LGRRGGNLTVTGRLGKSRQYRLLYCRSCRARFSERKGTPLYGAHLPEEKVTSILEHITSLGLGPQRSRSSG
jgi:LacI family transcriptional regulator